MRLLSAVGFGILFVATGFAAGQSNDCSCGCSDGYFSMPANIQFTISFQSGTCTDPNGVEHDRLNYTANASSEKGCAMNCTNSASTAFSFVNEEHMCNFGPGGGGGEASGTFSARLAIIDRGSSLETHIWFHR